MIEEKEKYLKKLLSSHEGMRILSDRLEDVITDKEFYKLGLLTEIVDMLILNGYGQAILARFPIILKQALRDEVLPIVHSIFRVEGGKEIINKNIKSICNRLDGEDIVEVINLLGDEQKEKIALRNSFAYELYSEGLIGENVLGSIIKADVSIFIEEIIKEVSNGEKLESLNGGSFSDVIQTNGYVIKIGETRDRYEIPYHPNILQPLLRERIVDEDGKSVLVIEVQNLVDVNKVTEKDREKLKKRLEASGIRCTDMDDDNVGILIKPNKRMLYRGVGGIIDYEDIKEETLEPGEPVILDTDMLEKE